MGCGTMSIKASFLISGFWLAWALIVPSPVHAQQFDWQEFVLPEDVELTAIAASPNRLIAVGYIGDLENGPGVIYTSTDGFGWQPIDIGADEIRFTSIAYIENRWLIARDDGNLQTSADGLNWNTITIPDDLKSVWNSIVSLGDELLLIGNSDLAELPGPLTRVLATSDLTNWEVKFESPGGFGGIYLFGVVSSGQRLTGLFYPTVIGSPFIYLTSSDDGTNWFGYGEQGVQGIDLAWDGRRFLTLRAVNPDAPSIGELLTDDTWQFTNYPDVASFNYNVIAASGPNLIIRSRFESAPLITSPDGGRTWFVQETVDLTAGGRAVSFVKWQSRWIGVGQSIISGTLELPRSVSVLSGWSWLVLVGLMLVASIIALRRA